jgi:hypothetical protein
MSARLLPRRFWCLALFVAAGALLAGLPTRATLAQQPAASGAGGAAHVGPSGENRGRDVRAPNLKIAPARERSIVHGGSNVVDHNAIGMPVPRPDGGHGPVGLSGRAAAPAPPARAIPSGALAGGGSRALPAPHIATPGPRPLVFGRGTIGGAAFTRPGTALKPVGGPTKSAAIGINGTNFRAKP